jgi:uncharacterized protein (TIGR02996 family)
VTDGEALLKAVTDNPDEATAALVLADWLQENGAAGLASALRTAAALRRQPATVYVVTAGDDYSARGVFSSRENADLVTGPPGARSEFGLNPEPDAYTLDYGVPEFVSGLRAYFVVIPQDDDRKPRVTAASPFETPTDDPGRLSRFTHPTYNVYLWARDEQHAVTIAHERRVALLAATGQRP